jgi:hypothetical protein
MRRVIWNVRPFNGRQVFLRIVDQQTGSWGHLTFDDFSTEGELLPGGPSGKPETWEGKQQGGFTPQGRNLWPVPQVLPH